MHVHQVFGILASNTATKVDRGGAVVLVADWSPLAIPPKLPLGTPA